VPSEIYILHVSAQADGVAIAPGESLKIPDPCPVWWKVLLPVWKPGLSEVIEIARAQKYTESYSKGITTSLSRRQLCRRLVNAGGGRREKTKSKISVGRLRSDGIVDDFERRENG